MLFEATYWSWFLYSWGFGHSTHRSSWRIWLNVCSAFRANIVMLVVILLRFRPFHPLVIFMYLTYMHCFSSQLTDVAFYSREVSAILPIWLIICILILANILILVVILVRLDAVDFSKVHPAMALFVVGDKFKSR